MTITISKIFAILAILLFLASTITIVSAREIIWTEYSDSTYTESEIQDIEPEEPCDEIIQPQVDHLGQDLEKENELRTEEYGQYMCINNQLQRTNTINGAEQTEFGQACGFEQPASKTQLADKFWILPITLLILIIITLLLIVSVAISRR